MGCGGSSYADDEELGLRQQAMTAAKTNDLDAMKKTMNQIKERYANDPDLEKKVRSAGSMWDSETPAGMFMMALKWAAGHDNVEMCKFIIECGATVDMKMYPDRRHNGAFRSPAPGQPGGVTALGVAAGRGALGAVEFLLKAGADPNYRDLDGDSAADCAGKEGHMEVQKVLWKAMAETPA